MREIADIVISCIWVHAFSPTGFLNCCSGNKLGLHGNPGFVQLPAAALDRVVYSATSTFV